jgi:hypothetical protein
LVSALVDNNGRFVITCLQADVLLRERRIKIYSRSGKLDFSAEMVEAGSSFAEVFVASIGIQRSWCWTK